MTNPDPPPLAWLDFPAVRAFYRACIEHSITYLFAPHDEATTTRIEFVDEPMAKLLTARKYALLHDVPDEQVLRVATIGGWCAGHRIRIITGPRSRMLHGWICNDAGGRFRSCTEAAESVKCHPSAIRQCVIGTITTAMGLRWWREVDGKRVTVARRKRLSRPIRYRGTDYRSIKAAAKQLGPWGVTRRMIETRAERLTA